MDRSLNLNGESGGGVNRTWVNIWEGQIELARCPNLLEGITFVCSMQVLHGSCCTAQHLARDIIN